MKPRTTIPTDWRIWRADETNILGT